MNKKGLLIIIGILLFGLGIFLGYVIFNQPSNKCEVDEPETPKEKIKNVEPITIDGNDYYIIQDDYDGEYYYQRASFKYNLSDPETRDKIKMYNTTEVMYYQDYVNFCNKWNLKQKYTDANKKYAVVAYASAGSPIVEARLANYNTKNGIATIYLHEKVDGFTADVGAYFLVIPVPNDVYKEEIVSLITKEEANNIKKYGSKEDPRTTEDKPIVYIYPEKETEVTVKLGNENLLTTTYPKYNNGWTVTAKPDGTLTQNNKKYYGLYWEGKNHNVKIKEDGFVIKGKDTAKFLEEKLAILGLNEKEANEFIIYWLPKMEHNKYNYIRFETKEEINSYMPLEITPKPDSIIRIVMDFKALDNKINIKEQKLTTPTRTGFTVVEWGGSEIK